ncbi:MAG: hypothetical protein CMB20_003340 [Methanobacteriota archaeon]|nr:MAG: hypothetical protein CMB20_003340 [Euryarchaeota archaeon]|tara:strand:- start:1441 stop:2223 length:783 start_codon:yes stop_codon:yes gene_type:complete
MELFSERIIDRHRRWWIEKELHPHKNLAGKIKGPEYVFNAGHKVPTIYHVGDKAESLPKFKKLPERFVIKPTKGWSAKNVFVMVDGVNLLDQKKWKRNQIVKSLEKNSELDSNDRVKLLVEEFLVNWDGVFGIPLDYKFFMFGGEIAFCHIIKRLSNTDTSRNLHWYVDENFESIGMKIITTQNPETELCSKPTCWDDLVSTAKGLGEKLDMFMRIDLYGTTRGAVFGEFTPQPHGGRGYTIEADKWLGSLWSGIEGAGN